MRHDDLLFCTACGSFCNRSRFCPAGSFNAFRCCDAIGLAGITQSLLTRVVRRLIAKSHSSQLSLTRCRIRGSCRRLGLSLRLQLLFTNLLRGAMPQLGTILTA